MSLWRPALLLALLAAAPAFAAEPAKGFDRYPLFRSRNVFDPDRRPSARTVTAAPVAGPKGPSAVILTGTMENNGQALAFFSSGQVEFNKVLPVKQAIAGFTIATIAAGTVEVERDGKKTLLLVGSALPIEGATAPAVQPADGAVVTSPADAPPAGDASTPTELDEIRRRMMERHQKEMSQ